MTGTQVDRCGACNSVRAVRDLDHPWTMNAVCRDESACYAAATSDASTPSDRASSTGTKGSSTASGSEISTGTSDASTTAHKPCAECASWAWDSQCRTCGCCWHHYDENKDCPCPVESCGCWENRQPEVAS